MDKYIETKRKIQEALRGNGYSNKSITLPEFNFLYEPYKDRVSEEIFSDFLGMPEKSLERLQKGITSSVIILKTDEPLLTREYELQDLLRPLHTNELIDYEQFCRIFEPYKDEMNENSFSRILGLAQYTFLNMKKIKGKRGIIFKTPEVSQERMIEVQREVISKGYINRKISYDEFLELYEPYRLEMQDFEFAKITRIRDVAKLRDGRKQYVIIFNGFISLEREEKKDEIIQELKDQGYCNKHMSLEDINELYEKYSKDITFDEFIEMLEITRSQLSTIKNTKGRVIVLKTEKASEDLKDRIEFELRQKGYSNKLVSKEEFDELFRPYSSKLTIEEFGQAVGLSSASYGNLKRNRATILSTYRPTEERGEEVREELRNLGYEDGTEITYPEFIDLFNKYQTEMVEIEFAEVLGITYGKYRDMKYKGKSIKLFASISNVPAKRMAEIRIDLRNQGYSGRLIQKNVFDELYEPYREELTTSDFEKVLMLNLSQAAALRKTDSKPATILPYERLSNERRNQIKEESDTLIGLDEEYINKEIFMSLYDRYKTEISAEEYAELLGLTIYAVKNSKNNPNLKLRIRGKKEEPKAKEEPKKVIEKSHRIQTDDTAHTKAQKSLNAKRALKKRIIEELKSQGHTNELVDYNQFSALYKPYTRGISETEFYTLLGISYSNFKDLKDGKIRCIILKENTKIDEYIRRVKAEVFELGIDGTLIDYDTFKKIYSNYSEQFSERQFAKVLGIDILKNLKVSRMRVTLKKKVFKIAMHQLKNSREYSMEELEQICSKLDISVEELFQYLRGVYNPKIKDVKKVSVNSLLKKGKIYIGDITPELEDRIKTIAETNGYDGRLISNANVDRLFSDYYIVMSKSRLLQILGIEYTISDHYGTIERRRILLKRNQIKNALDELLEARYYTQEELRRVCSRNNLSVKELLQYLIGIHTKGIDELKKINVDDLLKKDRLYLGEVTPEIKEIIVDEILKRGYDGKLIKLSELQKLYLPYRILMSKFAFTQIIGASNRERDVSKKGDQMTRIVLKRRELENILSNLSTPRYYSHGELDDMCSQNGVSLEEFLQYYMTNHRRNILDSKTLDVSEQLKMDKIFFGVAPIPKEFLDNHMEEILTIGKKIEDMLKRKLIKYTGNLIDVYTDAILDLIQKNGSLVYNSKDDDEAINRIKSYLKLSITDRYIRESKKTIMTSLDETIYDDDNEQTRYSYLASKEKKPEDNAVEIVRNILQEEKRIPHNTIMQILAETRDMYKKGYKYEDIVDEMQDKYGITPNELLKILKGELARKIENKDPQK